MEIIALKEYTDNKISLYEGEIRNIGNNLAQKLIEEGVVAEHDQISPSGGDSSSDKVVLIKIDLTMDGSGGDPVAKWNEAETKRFEDLLNCVNNDQYLIIKGNFYGQYAYYNLTEANENVLSFYLIYSNGMPIKRIMISKLDELTASTTN